MVTYRAARVSKRVGGGVDYHRTAPAIARAQRPRRLEDQRGGAVEARAQELCKIPDDDPEKSWVFQSITSLPATQKRQPRPPLKVPPQW